MLPVLILANPKKKRTNMAKKKKAKKKKNGGGRTARANGPRGPRPNPRRGARRRRNGSEKGASALAVVGGVVGGGLLGGALDYGLAGMASTASPTRRAMIFGGLTVATTIGAVVTDGNVSGAMAGIAGANAGLCLANTGRAVAVWVASRDEKSAQKDDKTKPTQPNTDAGRQQMVHLRGDAAMRAVVAGGIPTARQPAGLQPPRSVRGNLRAVIMGDRA